MTGFELKTARERLGWSREKLARKLEVSYQAVYRWERGDRPISGMAAELLRRVIRGETRKQGKVK